MSVRSMSVAVWWTKVVLDTTVGDRLPVLILETWSNWQGGGGHLKKKKCSGCSQLLLLVFIPKIRICDCTANRNVFIPGLVWYWTTTF